MLVYRSNCNGLPCKRENKKKYLSVVPCHVRNARWRCWIGIITRCLIVIYAWYWKMALLDFKHFIVVMVICSTAVLFIWLDWFILLLSLYQLHMDGSKLKHPSLFDVSKQIYTDVTNHLINYDIYACDVIVCLLSCSFSGTYPSSSGVPSCGTCEMGATAGAACSAEIPEWLTAGVVELAGNSSKVRTLKHITPRHLQLSILRRWRAWYTLLIKGTIAYRWRRCDPPMSTNQSSTNRPKTNSLSPKLPLISNH